MNRNRGIIFFAAIAIMLMGTALGPQAGAQTAYKLPPKEVVDILDAPPAPQVMVSPSGGLILLLEPQAMPSIEYLSRPMLRLAGMRITPRNNSRQILSFIKKLSLVRAKAATTPLEIRLPEGADISGVSLSPDESRVAFLRYLENGVELWTADTSTGQARAVTPAAVNALFYGYEWLPDSKRMIVSIIPESRGPAPAPPAVPSGPDIQETSGRSSKAATYQDLLTSAWDETTFEYYATSQLAVVDITTGALARIGRPGIYTDFSPSPDMGSILVECVKRPFSRAIPYFGFSRSLEIWNMAGDTVRVLADLPTAEDVPINGVQTGPRSPRWMAHKPAALVWIEALDGGDPEKEVPFRDRYMTLAAPFAGAPTEILKLRQRAAGLAFLSRPGLALASEYEWKKHHRTTWLADLDRPGTAPKLVFDLDDQDGYKDPGMPVMATVPGTIIPVVRMEKDWIYLSGMGASPQGDHPFLDRMNIKTLARERLFHCQDPWYESFTAFADLAGKVMITRRESKTEPPNYFLLDLRKGTRRALTDIKDPAPQLTGLRKELIRYRRSDGVELSGTLYYPTGYKPGERRPAVIWAYPIEYSSASTAGQVRGSANRFTYFRGASQLFFVTRGYMVLDNAEMPVVGDPKTVNDTFIKQIVDNAAAAIRKLDEMGVADPRRVGVGGHSYGAFMTANLLAHCDLFAAGVARSGAYNRTLTPFGFQSERRTLWEAQDTYIKMSPFMFADKIKTPLLLIHGEADNNSGTFPIQSERLFAALQGFGATARLVMLPNESHGYSARESVLDVLAEMFEWFDRYVKNRKVE